jgi:hypothetical protein
MVKEIIVVQIARGTSSLNANETGSINAYMTTPLSFLHDLNDY